MSDETPSSQITRNCHFISRFLTKPWEFSDQRGQRQLYYYDFDRDAFGHHSSKTLFAEEDLNAPAVETWLRDIIETPLGNIRPRLAAGDANALDDPRFFRAAILMLWLQGIRSKSVEEEGIRRDLESLAAMPLEHIDALIGMILRDFRLTLTFTVVDGENVSPLTVPSTGTFLVSIGDQGCMSGFSFALGVPLDPACALLAIPVEDNGPIDLSLLAGSLSNRSIGLSPSRRVVLHPDVSKHVGEDQLRSILRECRQANDESLSNVQGLRRLIIEGFGKFGLSPEVDRQGRLVPFKE